MTKLRNYQVKLNKPAKAFIKSKRGTRAQVYAPTGAGKTVCFIELIKYAINQGATNIAITHPRIALSQDQLRRIKREFGTSVHFTSFHSGSHVIGQEDVLEKSTRDPVELNRIITQANKDGKPHITLSTYHSFFRLVNEKFDLLVCDEAHYLVQDRFYDWLSDIGAKKTLFYTATPVRGDTIDRGLMINGGEFGDIIAQVLPRELIKPGYIVAPLVQELNCDTDRSSDKVDIIDIIARAYAEQYRAITANGMPYAQMLVAARGVESDIREINRRLPELWAKIKTELTDAITDKVDVYTVEAETAYYNGRPMSRDAALEQLKHKGGNAILAHFDTLSEGIDIDTLTGVLMMRSLSKSKFIQTIGRCARPYIGDLDPVTREPRIDLYDPANKIDLRAKPRCIVTLPVIDGVWIGNADGVDIADAFIAAGYDDLATYLANSEDEAVGESTVTFELEDTTTTMAQVTDHRITRLADDMYNSLFNEA